MSSKPVTALAVDSPFALVGPGGSRVAPFNKPAPKVRPPTGFYRRPGSLVWYFRRRIEGVLINESTKFVDLEDARKWAEDRVKAQRYGDLGWATKTMPTVKQFYESVPRKPHDQSRLVPFVEAHKNERLNQITSTMCEAWIVTRLSVIRESRDRRKRSQVGRKYKGGTIRTECARLRAFFELAVGAKGFLRENPWKRVKLPKKSIRTRVLRAGDEQTRFLAALKDIDPMLERLARFVIGSGLRLAEFSGLRPCDVYDGEVHVQEEFAKGKSPRSVPVLPEILAILDEQREARGLHERSLDTYFGITSPPNLSRDFLTACKAAGIMPKITPHDLRRTYGTRMAFVVPPKVLQALMGHKDIQTTLEHYTHVEHSQLAALVHSARSVLLG
jgi:integrase